ncbi:N-glycosylase [Archaeoglobales archaeon]|nr:MAG: N-glycosylase [Archaeoglobales archaeon]
MSNDLIEKVEKLRPVVGSHVKRRIEEFLSFKDKDSKEWFSELCFCILTANSSAEMGIKIQNTLKFDGFAKLNEKELAGKLKELGYRFYNVRARYIVEARKYVNVKEIITSFKEPWESREWLVENVRGLGYKEASHFLRNTGILDFAILDRHILRIMEKVGIVRVPKTQKNISRKTYLEIEKKFIEIAKRLEMKPGELDLYLWYLSTGKVLK